MVALRGGCKRLVSTEGPHRKPGPWTICAGFAKLVSIETIDLLGLVHARYHGNYFWSRWFMVACLNLISLTLKHKGTFRAMAGRGRIWKTHGLSLR